MISTMLLATAALGQTAAQPVQVSACTNVAGKAVACPKKMRRCKPTRTRKCTKVTDYTGRVSYKW